MSEPKLSELIDQTIDDGTELLNVAIHQAETNNLMCALQAIENAKESLIAAQKLQAIQLEQQLDRTVGA